MNKNSNYDHNAAPKTVLILTDQANTLDQISKYCMGIGLLTRTATSSIEAANHIDFELPDLLIVDYEMPAQDGSTFVEFLDSRRPEWRMPVIILHNNPDSRKLERPQNLVAYFARRSPNLFSTIRMFAEELLAVDFAAANSTGQVQNSDDN
jgi:CheY-like chemotaxis protein